MGPDLEYIDGQTPIDEEEKEGLKIKTISSRGELNEFEQLNIQKAIEWSIIRNFTLDQVFTVDFIKEVHKQMFSEVWDWAGTFRKTNKNIGVDKHQIHSQLLNILDDCKYWIKNEIYPKDELAIRFKFRLVKVHPFPNGNGRHSRLCADILISHVLKEPIFTWGGKDLTEHNDNRTKYLEAIYKAEEEIFGPLIEFARSN
jgi:Fic-DOC domain mobile mystery protein B